MSLAELAEIANFSPFHFQRIFKSIVGETPKQYIKRLRLEGAAHHIYLKPSLTLLEVAIRYGFTSLEAFSRAFKNYYGVSPNAFRRSSEVEKREIIQAKTMSALYHVIDPASFLPASAALGSDPMEIKVLHKSAQKILFLPGTLDEIGNVVGSFKKLQHWAGVRDLLPEKPEFLALLLDFPAFTALEKCRFYACISVNSEPELSDEIEFMETTPATFASFSAQGGINEIVKAVTIFAHQWLPDSGFEIKMVPAVLIPVENPTVVHLHDITYQIYIGLKKKT